MYRHALVMADATGTIQYWSSGAESSFGHRAADAVGQPLDLIVPEEYRELHWSGFRKAMETGSAKLDGQTTEIPVRCLDGSVKVFPGAFLLLRDASKIVIGAMVIFTPV